MGKAKSPKNNYGTPGGIIDMQEFAQIIRKAEDGPFHTLKAVKSEIAKWKEKN